MRPQLAEMGKAGNATDFDPRVIGAAADK